MRKSVMLLLAVVALYLVTGAVLHLIYGPSFGFLSGEDSWLPDGQGGWVAHGHPSGPPPDEPSVEMPLLARYLPVFIPALLLVLVLFTPLGKAFEQRPAREPEEPPASKPGDSDTAGS